MKNIRFLLIVLGLGLSVTLVDVKPVSAQCAMCSLTAQNATENGNSQGKGLNNGILFLLAMPYLAALGIGTLWYMRYRAKKTANTRQTNPLSV